MVGLVFVAGTTATGVEPGTRRSTLPDRFAHSIVPIVAGYIVAHYLTYLVEVGQATLIQASDPLSNGSNWFGTAGWRVNYAISYHPTALATTKVLAVVLGHVVGVVAAHDRALALLPARAPHHRAAAAAAWRWWRSRSAGSTCCSRPDPAPPPLAGRRLDRAGRQRVDDLPDGAAERAVADLGERPAADQGAVDGRAVVGQEVQPGQPGEALDHAGDVLLRPAERRTASG